MNVEDNDYCKEGDYLYRVRRELEDKVELKAEEKIQGEIKHLKTKATWMLSAASIALVGFGITGLNMIPQTVEDIIKEKTNIEAIDNIRAREIESEKAYGQITQILNSIKEDKSELRKDVIKALKADGKFLSSVIGPTGKNGPKGVTGDEGKQGLKGEDGIFYNLPTREEIGNFLQTKHKNDITVQFKASNVSNIISVKYMPGGTFEYTNFYTYNKENDFTKTYDNIKQPFTLKAIVMYEHVKSGVLVPYLYEISIKP